ncbi:MAG TPA: hypothetical protein DDW68_06065 [Verrucomicrobiales bacterium]|nr:hypothetical protein [Verrucomicrobiales bacterium]HBE96719.1 hypothetical protein [Verrucomicrobiales bacterium]
MNFSEALTTTWKFFSEGGIFMLFLALCSLVAITVIIMKFLSLKKEQILPPHLEREIENFEENLEKGTLTKLQTEFERGENALARLCTVAISNAGRTQGEVQEAVQSSAREEIVRMNSGMPVLDVIITIAPLLGLLGTTSGLMTVFGDLDDKDTISRGIAVALSTTIVGLAIAVPAVIAQSYFTRRIETMAARLEVLLGKVVSACHQHVFFRDK